MSTRYYETNNNWNIRARRYPHDRSYIAWASKSDIYTSAGPLDCGGGMELMFISSLVRHWRRQSKN